MQTQIFTNPVPGSNAMYSMHPETKTVHEVLNEKDEKLKFSFHVITKFIIVMGEHMQCTVHYLT